MSSVSVFGLRFCCMRADFPESKIYLQTSNASSRIINSLFYNNSSGKYGGAVSFNSIGTITLTNLTFYSNSTDTEGGAIYGQFYSYTVNNSVFYNNTRAGAVTDNITISATLTLNYCYYYNGMSPSPIGFVHIQNSSSPFVSTSSTDSGFLYPAAVIQNEGNDAAAGLSLVTTDLAGNPRKNGTVDIGAYERQ